MLIKEADDQSDILRELEQRASGTGVDAKHATTELRMRKAGIKGESGSAYLIDFDYGQSPNWAVIHDLRLEHGGRVAQIDHVLINRWMDVYVLETKQFHAGIKITKDGEFLRWNNFRSNFEGMASPLEQNERHIAVLRDVMETIELPVRFGIRIPPAFHSFVLVAPAARIDRPKGFDTSRVIKADQLKKRLWKDIDDENLLLGLLKATKIVSRETVEFVGRQLAMLHRPLHDSAPEMPAEPLQPPRAARRQERIEPAFSKPTTTTSTDSPVCKQCASKEGLILFGRSYYFKCAACGTNTAMRPTCKPGHNPRLRKQKNEFFRECPECSTSTLYHRNTEVQA